MNIRFWVRRAINGMMYLRYLPQMLPAIILYFLMPSARKRLLIEDLNAFYRVEYQRKRLSNITAFYRLMVEYDAFRNVFYFRLGRIANLICWFMPRWKTLSIRTLKIDGGLYIQHGTSTRIGAKSIGKNFWTNQNVTVGWNGPGNPTIGDNVRIGTGAVVIGPINIGDNVNIGANAIVTKDVPSNTTVVPPLSHICKRNGKRVYEEL